MSLPAFFYDLINNRLDSDTHRPRIGPKTFRKSLCKKLITYSLSHKLLSPFSMLIICKAGMQFLELWMLSDSVFLLKGVAELMLCSLVIILAHSSYGGTTGKVLKSSFVGLFSGEHQDAALIDMRFLMVLSFGRIQFLPAFQ